MGLLEQINEMRNQGFSDDQIIGSLQEAGVSPKQIDDALNQLQIKKAITGEETMMSAPQAQEISNQTYVQQGGAVQQEYYPNDTSYSQSGTETMIEVADQVFSEKIQKIQKQVDIQNEFKTIAEVKLQSIEERLSRMEKMFDRLQMSILDKIGSYGKGLETAQKEIEMMENSFRKVVGSKTKK